MEIKYQKLCVIFESMFARFLIMHTTFSTVQHTHLLFVVEKILLEVKETKLYSKIRAQVFRDIENVNYCMCGHMHILMCVCVCVWVCVYVCVCVIFHMIWNSLAHDWKLVGLSPAPCMFILLMQNFALQSHYQKIQKGRTWLVMRA